MKKILITGATGYIGSWLTRYFLSQNFSIVAHGSSKHTLLKLEKRLNNQGYSSENIEFWDQDFMDVEWKFPDFQELGAIIHCAALTSVREGKYHKYDKYFNVNVLGTKTIAQKALENDILHFIHLSSGQIYGTPQSFPIDENTPKEPINLYGFSKLMSEEIVKSIGTFGLDFTIARPFSVYGKEQSNIISIIINKIKNGNTLTIYGDGNQTRAFMHINDICNAIKLMLGNRKCFKKEYNLSGPEEYSVNQLVKMISRHFGKEPELVYKDSEVEELKRNLADTTELQKLGFRYKYSLKTFIERIEY
jgi:UDP-glucose 4-epimerase